MAETRKTTADIATSDAFRMGLDDRARFAAGTPAGGLLS